MESTSEKTKEKIPSKVKWIAFVTIFIIAIMTSTAIYFITNNKITEEVNSKQHLLQNNAESEKIVNLETLTEVANKTEEELKEINKKELEEAEKKEKNTTTTTNKITNNKYYIKVNYGAQVVNIYTYDKDGKYTVPVKAFVCSTGTDTPRSGVYKIPAKIEWCFMFGDVYAHYCTQIVGNILFHSVPYLKRSNDTLEYWEYDKLGTRCSMGCIRLTARDAKWIYDNVPRGTQVEFYSSSTPGPLGKPTAQKISNAPGNLKWWDPTDPDSDNPWRTYKPQDDTIKNEQTNSIQNNTQNTETNINKTENNTQNQEVENLQETNNDIINNTENAQIGNFEENAQENIEKNDTEDSKNDIEETDSENKEENVEDNKNLDNSSEDQEEDEIVNQDKTDQTVATP